MENEITQEEIAAVFDDRERLARENEKLRAHFTKMREMRKDDMEIVGEYMEQNGKLRLEAQRLRAELDERRAEQKPLGEEVVTLRRVVSEKAEEIKKLFAELEETRAALDSKTEELNLIVLRWANRLKEAGIFDDSKSLGDYIDEGVQALAERQRLVSPSVQVDLTDEQVEALAIAICEAPDPVGHIRKWDSIRRWERDVCREEARAAYAHIGAEVANLREQVNGLCEIDMNAMAALSEVVGLRQELKQARAEANSATCAKQEHAVTIEGLIEKIEGLESELLKVRAERQTRPVKVRLPEVEEINGHLIKHNFSTTTRIEIEEALRYAASRAVIEVPGDLPSAGEIAAKLVDFWGGHSISPDKSDFGTVVGFVLTILAPWLQSGKASTNQTHEDSADYLNIYERNLLLMIRLKIMGHSRTPIDRDVLDSVKCRDFIPPTNEEIGALASKLFEAFKKHHGDYTLLSRIAHAHLGKFDIPNQTQELPDPKTLSDILHRAMLRCPRNVDPYLHAAEAVIAASTK